MSKNVTAFERTTIKTYEWLDELAEMLDWGDRQHAYAALRTSLQALRDRLPPDEAVELAAQLPMLIRGFYFEGWNPSATPIKVRDRGEFLAPLHETLQRQQLSTPPEEVARAVFTLLRRHVTAGELDDVVQVLPPEIRELFAAPVAETF